MPQQEAFGDHPIRQSPASAHRLLANRPRANRGALSRAALGAAFGACLIIAGGIGTACAQQDDDDLLPDQKFFRSILRGLGLRNGQEAGIEYKERPPLVVPPSRDLPPPQVTGSVAKQNPAWPADPDEKKRVAAKKANAERKRYLWEDEVRQLSPEELAANGKTAPGAGGRVAPVDLPGPQMSPEELGYKGGMWSDLFGLGKFFGSEKPEVATFTREPARTALTDPPPGYRTPSPAQPYGLGNARGVGKKKVEDRQEEGTLGK